MNILRNLDLKLQISEKENSIIEIIVFLKLKKEIDNDISLAPLIYQCEKDFIFKKIQEIFLDIESNLSEKVDQFALIKKQLDDVADSKIKKTSKTKSKKEDKSETKTEDKPETKTTDLFSQQNQTDSKKEIKKEKTSELPKEEMLPEPPKEEQIEKPKIQTKSSDLQLDLIKESENLETNLVKPISPEEAFGLPEKNKPELEMIPGEIDFINLIQEKKENPLKERFDLLIEKIKKIPGLNASSLTLETMTESNLSQLENYVKSKLNQ